ncbi:hypothetical protein Efla_003218 [Eimeria flavescens]
MDNFGHVFLIPSDGSQVTLADQSPEIWGLAAGGDSRELVSLMGSLHLADKGRGKQGGPPEAPRGPFPPSAAAGTKQLAEGGGQGSAAAAGGGETLSKGRRLPNVEHLLMAGVSGMQQPLQFRQSLAQQATRKAEQQGAPQQVGGAPSHLQAGKVTSAAVRGGRSPASHTESASPVKGTGRGGRNSEKGIAGRGSSLLGDGHLALQSALVTMLHLQQQGDLRRKPVFPKRSD